MTSIFKKNYNSTKLEDFENFKDDYENDQLYLNLIKSKTNELYNMVNVLQNTYNVQPVLGEGEEIKILHINPFYISNNLRKKNDEFILNFDLIKVYKIELSGFSLKNESILNFYNNNNKLLTSTHFLQESDPNYDENKILFLLNPVELNQIKIKCLNNGIFLNFFKIYYIFKNL